MKIFHVLSLVVFLVSFAVSTSADVEYIGTDKETQGEWEEKYGKDGVIIFAAKGQGVVDPAPGGEVDLVREGLITHYETPDGQRFTWTRGDMAHLLSTKALDGEAEKLNACAFAGGQVTVKLEVDAAQYQVAAYYGGNENTRVQDIYGYVGDDAPAEPDVTIETFGNDGAGVYVIWGVTDKANEPFTILTKQIGPVNAIISGVFVDVVSSSVESVGKLPITWGKIKAQ